MAAEIARKAGGAPVLVEKLDLADQASVAGFISRWRGPLHVLVNNAGVMALPEQRTAEGGRCSSRPITWVTSCWRTGCAARWPKPAAHASSR